MEITLTKFQTFYALLLVMPSCFQHGSPSSLPSPSCFQHGLPSSLPSPSCFQHGSPFPSHLLPDIFQISRLNSILPFLSQLVQFHTCPPSLPFWSVQSNTHLPSAPSFGCSGLRFCSPAWCGSWEALLAFGNAPTPGQTSSFGVPSTE